MVLDMNTSLSMAMAFAGSFSKAFPATSPTRSSLMMNRPQSVDIQTTVDEVSGKERPKSVCLSLYKGISDRPLGWKPRRVAKPMAGHVARDANLKRWDGTARCSAPWDALRRDPELWFPNGDCFVHLYGRGQSIRGPSFRVSFDILVESGCRPLLERFLVGAGSPSSTSSQENQEYFDGLSASTTYDLYIPAPSSARRGQAMLYHIATRNFFAWVYGRPLVGPHLGGALVGLLNSMTEFRSDDMENEMDILDYMDEEGYSDMRNSPDHALAVLNFAETFHFRNIWIDAFAHCTGMSERLSNSSQFEFVSRVSKAIIARASFEMQLRLEECSERLSVWLEDDLSASYLGLTPPLRAHLDRFRSFLQSYYVAKLGYYPPFASESRSVTFSKGNLCDMRHEFESLYAFLADETYTSSDPQPPPMQAGFCALQNIQAFDKRLHFIPLLHPIPLLPEIVCQPPTSSFTKRMSWRGIQPDKMQLDPRLASLASMTKATNRRNMEELDCPLIRSYLGFEKDVVFSSSKSEKSISPVDARKVRWIMVYAVLQTLRCATNIPDEVRDVDNVPYHISVQTAGCQPWKDEKPYSKFLRTQTEQMNDNLQNSASSGNESPPVSGTDEESLRFSMLEPDIDYRPVPLRTTSASSLFSFVPSPRSRTGTIRRALASLGNMPELRHPKPVRNSFHEILVHGYGNGLNAVSVVATDVPEAETEKNKENPQTRDSSEDTVSSRWSKSDSGNTSASSSTNESSSRRSSDASLSNEVLTEAEQPPPRAGAKASSVYTEELYMPHLQPEPLQLTEKIVPLDNLLITQEVKVQYEAVDPVRNAELYQYLSS